LHYPGLIFQRQRLCAHLEKLNGPKQTGEYEQLTRISEYLALSLLGIEETCMDTRKSRTGAWPPTTDSELRFYAALWGAYGFILIAVARDLRAMLHYVPLLAATFFVGGAGRALSYFQVGPPHPFFVFLMVIELVLPIIFLMLWFRVRSQVA
jgi:hypothetical protein